MPQSNYGISWPLIGNPHITNFLEKSLFNGQVSGACIFNGPADMGKTTLAVFFAKILLCANFARKISPLPCGVCPSCRRFDLADAANKEKADSEPAVPAHGDFHFIERAKDKKNISIEQIRDFIKTLCLSSFLDSYKIGIIKQAECLSLEAANALLKTLEEPRAQVVIILVTKDLAMLPATIASRSKILNFRPVRSELIYDHLVKVHKASRTAAVNISRLSWGRPALALKFLQDKEFFRLYEAIFELFMKFPEQDIAENFLAIEKFSKDNEVLSSRPGMVIEIWQSIIRDCLLYDFGLNDLIGNNFRIDALIAFKNKLETGRLLALHKILDRSKEFLKANLSPRLVLENISLEFV